MDSLSITAEQADVLEHAVGGRVFAFVQAPPCTKAYFVVQRTIDLAVSIVALLLLLPLIVLIAVVIRFDSPGPALFRQQRVGRNGRLFSFYKFRTMWHDARARFPELYAYQYSDDEICTMCFKLHNDPRQTRFGRHLRKTSIDELPNFLNVLLGSMTLVGPRPEIPEMLPYYSEQQRMKFSVKPGVTGLAQISGRGNLSFQDTIAADLAYCHNRSIRYDLGIFFATIKSILVRDGAF